MPWPHTEGGAGRESLGAQQGSLAYLIFKGAELQEGGTGGGETGVVYPLPLLPSSSKIL